MSDKMCIVSNYTSLDVCLVSQCTRDKRPRLKSQFSSDVSGSVHNII